MNNIKKYIITLLGITISIIILTLLVTTLYYFNIINNNTFKIAKISIIIITLLVNCIILGRNSNKKGYLDGIKLGTMLIIFSTLVSFLEKQISFKIILYNIIILITTTLGSIIGINTKNKKRDI